MAKQGMFSPLSVPAFRSLFSAQLFSDLGNWLDMIAIQVIIVYHWGLGEEAVAGAIMAMSLPWVIAGPFASVFVDRWPKKAVMIVCSVLKASFILGLFFAPNIYILLLFIFLKGTAGAVFDPARQGAIKQTVPEKSLAQAVTLSQLSVNSMKIIGPALGGAVIAGVGPKTPFLLEVGGIFISILFLLALPSIKNDEEAVKEKDAPGFWSEFNEGLRCIRKSFILSTAILTTAIAFFVIFLYDGLFIILAKTLNFDAASFGLLIGFIGAGSVAGSLVAGQWTKWQRKPLTFMTAMIAISGAVIVLIGLGGMGVIAASQAVWLGTSFILGIGTAMATIPYGFILQSETPSALMGRVSSAAQSFQTLAMLIAPLIGAALSKWLGVGMVMMISGVITIFIGVFVLIAARSKLSARTNAEQPAGF